MVYLAALLVLLGFFVVVGLGIAGLAVLFRAIECFDDFIDERKQSRIDERQGLRRAKK